MTRDRFHGLTSEQFTRVAMPPSWWRADHEVVRDALGALRAQNAPQEMIESLQRTAEMLLRASSIEEGQTLICG